MPISESSLSTFPIDPETLVHWVESVLHRRTGQPLSDLQRVILHLCLNGQRGEQRYLEIANAYGCTEGHAKDVGAQLWRSLSQALGEKITKRNLRAAVTRCLNKARNLKAKAISSTMGSCRGSYMGSQADRSSLRSNSDPYPIFDPAAHQLFRWSWDEARDDQAAPQ